MGAYELVVNLQERICKHELVAEDGTPIRVTASFGIAAMPEDVDNKLDLIRLADNMMYRVKATTRNGIMMA